MEKRTYIHAPFGLRAAALTILLVALTAVTGCGTVRQKDLDAWVGQPVEALDTQPFFVSLPMVKTVTQSGVEIRNYINGASSGSCFGSGYASGTAYNPATFIAFQNCTARFGVSTPE